MHVGRLTVTQGDGTLLGPAQRADDAGTSDGDGAAAAAAASGPAATVAAIATVRPAPWRALRRSAARLTAVADRLLPSVPPVAATGDPALADGPACPGRPAAAVAGMAVPAEAVPAEAGGAVADQAGADHRSEGHHILHLPSPAGFVRHALPALIESTIGPAVLFYLVLVTAGFRGALLAALAWSYVAAGRRVIRRQRMPGMLLLGVVLLTLRTVVSFVTGSAFLYFVQPSIGTFAVAVLFVVTAALRRPLIERLAHDFCPLDAELMARPHVRAFFLRISVLWALVLLTNVGLGLFLLLESSLRAFVVERTALSVVLIGAGIVVSTLWFVRTMRGVGVSVRWASART